MTELFHYFSADLSFSATGDLAVADGLEESKQRILRRLLTNPQDYLWQPDYGAGLPQWIGRTLDEEALAALIKAQMYAEGGVSHSPEPVINLQAIPNGIATQITYTHEETGETASLGFTVSA